jgi:hypothetical protein
MHWLWQTMRIIIAVTEQQIYWKSIKLSQQPNNRKYSYVSLPQFFKLWVNSLPKVTWIENGTKGTLNYMCMYFYLLCTKYMLGFSRNLKETNNYWALTINKRPRCFYWPSPEEKMWLSFQEHVLSKPLSCTRNDFYLLEHMLKGV